MTFTVQKVRQGRFGRLVLICTMGVFGLNETAPPAVGQKVKPTADSANSIPTSLSENLGKLLTLTVKSDRFQPELCTSYQDAAQVFELLGSNMSGGSNSGDGVTQWSCNRESDKWKFDGQYGMASKDGAKQDVRPNLKFEFIDKTDSGWRLNATANDEGRVSLLAVKKDSAESFWLHQQANGSLFVVEVSRGRILAGADANYNQLLKSQPQIGNDILQSELRRWGLSKVSGRFSTEVRDLLLQQFTKPDEKTQQDFDKAVAELGASVFERREQASAWIKENAKSHVGLILATLIGPELTPEPRARLHKILEQTLTKSDFETISQIEKQQLAADPEQLVWLLGAPTEENTRSNIYDCLRQITGQTLGNDPQLWRDWLTQSGKQSTIANDVVVTLPPPDSYPNLQGVLLELAPIAAELLPLAVSAGKIQLDRQPWSKRYDEKSVRQLAQELRQYVVDRRLPPDWINVDDDLLEGIDYPHLIFAQLESLQNQNLDDEAKNMRRMARLNRMYYRQASNNLQLQTEQLRASLETDDQSRVMRRMRDGGDKTPKPIYVLTLVDEKSPADSLLYAAWPNGVVRIVITGQASFVQIFQSADGQCSLDCAVENTALHREFASADALLVDPHFTEKIADYLKQYGVQFNAVAKELNERP